MKTLKLFLPALLAIAFIGCASFETTSYQTITTVAQTVEAARKAWVEYVTQQRVVLAHNPAELTKLENNVAQGGDIYAKYQEAMRNAKAVVESYKAGSATQDQVTAALTVVSQLGPQFIMFINNLIH